MGHLGESHKTSTLEKRSICTHCKTTKFKRSLSIKRDKYRTRFCALVHVHNYGTASGWNLALVLSYCMRTVSLYDNIDNITVTI